MLLMNINNNVIKGDSQVTGYTDWITIDSLQFGVGRGISASGSGQDRDTSTPSFSEIVISKSSDITSGPLFVEACAGKSLTKIEIVVLQTSSDKIQELIRYELTAPIVSSFSQSSGGDRPTDSISINYTGIKFKYNQFKEGDAVVEGKYKGYDLKTAKIVTA